MPGADLQAFKRDADLLYKRGLQCARDGDRAGAELALRQAISLNPLHEQAWLRLSDTIDDSHEIAVCLRVVLQINPNNAQAQRGLTWLRQQTRSDQNAFFDPLLAAPSAGAPDAWWRVWHKAQRAWVWSLRALLLLPILLLVSTLSLRTMIANLPLPATDAPIASLAPVAGVQTIDTIDPARMLSYFGTVNAERDALHAATAAYEESTSVSQVAQERIDATLALLDQVQRSHGRLAALPVPAALAPAHQHYLEGLALEHEALKQMLHLQRSYDPQQARAATAQLQAARARIDAARGQWAAYGQNTAASGTATNGQ